MSETLSCRINYRGGKNQKDRMIADKLQSLRGTFNRSYQHETAIIGEQEFNCLINPNKLTLDLDDKMLSIPFEDFDLKDESQEKQKVPINLKVGDAIGWKETNTHWIIYSQHLTEIAYFRGYMRQCEEEPVEVNGHQYWVYIKGPDEKTIDWTKTKYTIYNELNYTLEMYISKTEETEKYFHRFAKFTFQGKPWEVQAVDRYTNKGLLIVYLKEDYSNSLADVGEGEQVQPNPETPGAAYIMGPNEVYPYDIITYNVIGATGGTWSLSNQRAKIIESTNDTVLIEIVTGRSGDVTLKYSDSVLFNIKIKSL